MANNNRRGLGNLNFSSSGGSGVKLPGIDSLLSNQAAIGKQNQLQSTAVPNAQAIMEQMGGNPPAGSKINQGGVDIPLNRKLTGDERSDISSANVIEPHFNNIVKMIKEGYLNSKSYGNIGRTVKQGIVDSGIPLLTGGNKNIEKIQSEFNKLKSKLPFDSGGKQLTGTEKALVFKLFNVAGKSDEVALDDLNFAMNILREKRRLALGGSLAGSQFQEQSMQVSGFEQERQKAISAIQAGADQSKVEQHFLSKTGQKLNG